MKNKLLVISAAFLILLAGAMVLTAPAGAVDWPEIKELSQEGVRYINGGFGIDERDVMPDGYPLKVIFATAKGHYLSDVDVSIFESGGKKAFGVTADNGPWLLVDLPSGSYRLEAVHNGHKKEASFKVASQGTRTVLISWPVSQVDMGLKE
jgi:hypothetical protein